MNRSERFYKSFNDEFIESKKQDFVLPENYEYEKTTFFGKIYSAIIYGLAVFFSFFYCTFFLHLKVYGKKKIKKVKSGFFLYSNHTQPVGDVFIPALSLFPKRIYTVVSLANYGIPFIGKILPFLGAIPIQDSFSGMKKFNRAIESKIKKRHPIVIYPEAHVWEYYNKIRPFPNTSFKFPVKYNVPAFSQTVTYKKSKIFKRPIMEVFLDGPFYPQTEESAIKAENLKERIYNKMLDRSKNSDIEFIKYTFVDKAQNEVRNKDF